MSSPARDVQLSVERSFLTWRNVIFQGNCACAANLPLSSSPPSLALWHSTLQTLSGEDREQRCQTFITWTLSVFVCDFCLLCELGKSDEAMSDGMLPSDERAMAFCE